MQRNNGFSIVEALMLFGIIVLLAGVGYVGWKAFTQSEDGVAQTTSVSTKQSAEVITTKADLEAAEKALSELDFDDDESDQAEAQANL